MPKRKAPAPTKESTDNKDDDDDPKYEFLPDKAEIFTKLSASVDKTRLLPELNSIVADYCYELESVWFDEDDLDFLNEWSSRHGDNPTATSLRWSSETKTVTVEPDKSLELFSNDPLGRLVRNFEVHIRMQANSEMTIGVSDQTSMFVWGGFGERTPPRSAGYVRLRTGRPLEIYRDFPSTGWQWYPRLQSLDHSLCVWFHIDPKHQSVYVRCFSSDAPFICLAKNVTNLSKWHFYIEAKAHSTPIVFSLS